MLSFIKKFKTSPLERHYYKNKKATWRLKVFVIQIFNKEFVSNSIKNSYNSTIRKQETNFKKKHDKILNRYFTFKDM